MSKIWRDYEPDFNVERFVFEGRDAWIVYPENPNGKLILKTEYRDSYLDFEIAMIKRGYYHCFIAHHNRWATPDEVDCQARFVKFVAEKLNIEPKCSLVGISCGGLYATKLAEKYPELVSCMYIDAPVLNFLSVAGLGTISHEVARETFWKELVEAYGFTRASIVTYRESPIDHLDVLIKHNIPILMIYGDADTVIVYEENGKVLEDYYRKHGGILETIVKHGGDHEPHSLEDVTPIIEFVEKYC